LNVVRIGHPARVTEQSLSKTLDARIATHPHFHELRVLRKKNGTGASPSAANSNATSVMRNVRTKKAKKEGAGTQSDADMLEFYIEMIY